MRLTLAAAAFAVACSPVIAQECTTITVEDLQTLVEQEGGQFIGGAGYDGASSDMAIIYAVNGIVRLVLFKDGCAVGPEPIALDNLAPEVEPLPQTFNSPALRAPKEEGGA